MILLSLILGCTLGALYAFFFVKRFSLYLTPNRRNVYVQTFLLLASFLGRLGLIAAAFVFCVKTIGLSLLWSSSAFMTSFWLIVWRYTKKLV